MPTAIRDFLEKYNYSPEHLLNSLIRMGNWDVDEAADAIRAAGGKLTPERVKELEKLWGMKPRPASLYE